MCAPSKAAHNMPRVALDCSKRCVQDCATDCVVNNVEPLAAGVLGKVAQTYNVDTDAIALKVKQEFAAKEKAKSTKKTEPKPTPKGLKKTA